MHRRKIYRVYLAIHRHKRMSWIPQRHLRKHAHTCAFDCVRVNRLRASMLGCVNTRKLRRDAFVDFVDIPFLGTVIIIHLIIQQDKLLLPRHLTGLYPKTLVAEMFGRTRYL